jgi:hypothetical protein
MVLQANDISFNNHVGYIWYFINSHFYSFDNTILYRYFRKDFWRVVAQMNLIEKVVRSAINNYGLNFEMAEKDMLHAISRVIYSHYIRGKLSIFEAKKSTELIMTDKLFLDSVMTEIEYRKQGLR